MHKFQLVKAIGQFYLGRQIIDRKRLTAYSFGLSCLCDTRLASYFVSWRHSSAHFTKTIMRHRDWQTFVSMYTQREPLNDHLPRK